MQYLFQHARGRYACRRCGVHLRTHAALSVHKIVHHRSQRFTCTLREQLCEMRKLRLFSTHMRRTIRQVLIYRFFKDN